ncbi:hypothetical protein C453_09753 [Haloferax elongans ATCC BAA-1513]|uniref:Copper resistance protein D domain-containing protein n=1 Tax=Haloferax elongans ATCC BAA-1513 TaxID=1230453 RepID=M0HQW5_HALEO|nr:CopD family protein [Haloferax elongans]ELZ86092.1 hypothetical protein C453_09753 [Haloferax elongans ATCC BAA-1513]
MSAASALLVRFVHIVGMTILFGGAIGAWVATRTTSDRGIELAARYEWIFWGAMGVIVVTGVGNLGAVGPPGPETTWGLVLTVKLALVVVFVLGSFVRTLVVLGWLRAATVTPDATSLRTLYAATAGWLLVLVAFAEVLAHG